MKAKATRHLQVRKVIGRDLAPGAIVEGEDLKKLLKHGVTVSAPEDASHPNTVLVACDGKVEKRTPPSNKIPKPPTYAELAKAISESEHKRLVEEARAKEEVARQLRQDQAARDAAAEERAAELEAEAKAAKEAEASKKEVAKKSSKKEDSSKEAPTT